MNATYYHISKTTRAELIKLLIDINHRLADSRNNYDANMARKANVLAGKLIKLNLC